MVLPLVFNKSTIFKKTFIANCLADSFLFALLADRDGDSPRSARAGGEGTQGDGYYLKYKK